MKKYKVISVIVDAPQAKGLARIETIEAANIDGLLEAWRLGLQSDGFGESQVDLVSITAL